VELVITLYLAIVFGFDPREITAIFQWFRRDARPAREPTPPPTPVPARRQEPRQDDQEEIYHDLIFIFEPNSEFNLLSPHCSDSKVRMVKKCNAKLRALWERAHHYLQNKPPHDIAVPLPQNPFLARPASLWISQFRSWSQRDFGVVGELCGGSFWRSQCARSHSALSFALHFFTILTLLLERCVTLGQLLWNPNLHVVVVESHRLRLQAKASQYCTKTITVCPTNKWNLQQSLLLRVSLNSDFGTSLKIASIPSRIWLKCQFYLLKFFYLSYTIKYVPTKYM